MRLVATTVIDSGAVANASHNLIVCMYSINCTGERLNKQVCVRACVRKWFSIKRRRKRNIDVCMWNDGTFSGLFVVTNRMFSSVYDILVCYTQKIPSVFMLLFSNVCVSHPELYELIERMQCMYV